MTALWPPVLGLPRFEARDAILATLRASGALVDSVDHPMVVPRCSRTGDIVETRVCPQWLVSCDGMAKVVAILFTKIFIV